MVSFGLLGVLSLIGSGPGSIVSSLAKTGFFFFGFISKMLSCFDWALFLSTLGLRLSW